MTIGSDLPGHLVEREEDTLQAVELPQDTALPQQHPEPWSNGISAVDWRLGGNDDQNKLVDLQANDVIVAQAQVRDGFARSATGHRYLCSLGLILRGLGSAGTERSS